MRKKPIYLSVVAVAVVFIFLLGPGSASGQLVVESSFPKDGDTNVDTLITVEFTFSAPLDTTADFPDPGDFYLGMLLPYDYTIGPPDSITISPDFKTVYFHNIRLMDNNRNIIGILAARSQDGDLLDIPCVITFTTADTLPTGSISGTISYPDGDPRGALVAIQSAFIGEDVFDGMTVVNSSSGEYTISYVDAGKYYPISVKDEDRNGELDLFGGSPFGFYNPDGDRKPDTVRVESGQNLADINIELKLAEPVTARELVPDAQDLARETFPDAMLSAVYGPDVNPDGTAKMWIYRFFSESLDTLTTIIGSSVFLIDMGSDEDEDDYYYDYYYYYYYYGGYNDYDDDDPFLDDLPLPDNWIDSDVAIDSAKTNGGQAFLDQFPESEINVVLISFIWEPGEMPRVYMRGGNKNNRKILKKLLPRGVLNNTTQETDTLAIWIVDFYEIEGANEEFIIIDAITGKPVQLFPEGNPTTARFNMEMVEPKAKAWAPDAYLVAVTSHFSHISPEGLAEMWGYIYFSVSHDSSAVFIMAEGFLLYQGGLGWEQMSKMPLPENWIDSDAAIAVSELNGGKVFRIENEDAWVTCGVGTGIWPFDLNKPTWQVNYDTYYGYYPSLTNYIDALTGELLKEGTAVTRDPVLPDKFSLEQNYPNPFNPETTVEYNVPELSQVNISVLNVYGQNVATLVHEDKNPGSYKVLWSGRDDKGRSLPSGVYFYRMKAGDFTAIKKMVLVR